MAWTAWLIGKTESRDAVECLIEFRSDQVADKLTRTVILSPTADGITDQASARQKLREKVTIILNELNDVEKLGDLVEANIGQQILPLV